MSKRWEEVIYQWYMRSYEDDEAVKATSQKGISLNLHATNIYMIPIIYRKGCKYFLTLVNHNFSMMFQYFPELHFEFGFNDILILLLKRF